MVWRRLIWQNLLNHESVTDAYARTMRQTLHQGMTKKCVGDLAFGAAAPRLWNELPLNIRASGTLPMFRKYLKTYLFIRHFN